MPPTPLQSDGPPLATGLRARIVQGLAWQIVGRGGEHGVRLVANIILARLLSPDDFGLMGLVAMALLAVEAIAFLATNEVILHSDRGRDDRFLGTVFTVALLRSIILAAVLAACAPWIAAAFDQPQATSLFVVVALHPVLLALCNPAANVLMKDLRFRRWTIYRFVGVVSGTGLTIALALQLRSAWALLLGQLGTTALLAIGSYLITAQRPRPSMDREAWKEIRRYGLRAAGTPILLALVHQAPALLLGRLGGPALLGIFLLNLRLADIFRELAIQAVGRVFVPAYSTLKHDLARLRHLWLRALSTITILTIPAASCVAWIGNDLPQLIFGADYRGDPGLFTLLVAGAGVAALIGVIGPLFWGIGRPCLDRRTQLVRVALIYGIGLPLALSTGAAGLALALLVASVATFLVALGLARTVVEARWHDVCVACAPGVYLALGVLVVLAMTDAVAAPAGGARVAVGVIALLALAPPCGYLLLRRRHAATAQRPTHLDPDLTLGVSP